MPIDPQAKLLRNARQLEARKPGDKAQRRQQAARHKRKHGKLSERDHHIISELVQTQPHELSLEQIASTATLLRRSPDQVAHAIVEARERLQMNAGRYVEIHREVAEAALKDGSDKALDVARKASEYAIQHLSARDGKGKLERIVEAEQQMSDAPRVQIGIALGGIVPRQSAPDE